ncbi:hypothetical protein ASG32_27270 [Methylobacterium sp. Leaf361]|uniref:hypothetical protein n=1 Tax=Methylobacterium sp. Leaf361 TaxID=1736352 RepID=UPI0006F36726|nr:hypothetical protein [Methylobacterium sp. Leaf361]KQS75467.1 hypothetical protein ASG32_27270 [Methylobacterium sp. Leaf361]
MTLRIIGTGDARGYDVIDSQTGASVLASLAALQLRLVLGNDGARLETDHAVEFDYAVPGAVRAFVGCPETGRRREVRAIQYADGDDLTFPRDFSASGEVEGAR